MLIVKSSWYKTVGDKASRSSRWSTAHLLDLPEGVPLRWGVCKSIIFTESSCVVEIKNTWLTLLSHFETIENNKIPNEQPAIGC